MTTIKGMANKAHIAGSGSDAIILALPDVYDNIKGACGVQQLAGDPPEGATGMSVGEAIRQGLVFKLRISYLDGTKRKSATIVVSQDKVKSAKQAVIGKTYRTFAITSANFPRRMRLS